MVRWFALIKKEFLRKKNGAFNAVVD